MWSLRWLKFGKSFASGKIPSSGPSKVRFCCERTIRSRVALRKAGQVELLEGA